MVQVNLSVVMGVLIILTGIALVGLQMMESNGEEMQNHSFNLIGAEAGATKFQVETSFPGVPIIALGMVLIIIGGIFSRGQ
ncbi:MAG: hypothetical protein HGA93_04395 [Methanothrix sp.]|jgi:hypothetical protein|nr:hypothetical protein [Methanothrix sp.]